MCFRSLPCSITQVSLRAQTYGQNVLLQDFLVEFMISVITASCPGPEPEDKTAVRFAVGVSDGFRVRVGLFQVLG